LAKFLAMTWISFKIIRLVLFLLLPAVFAMAQDQAAGEEVQVLTNRHDVLERPYVILISLDGFRWDYAERFKPVHLSRFIEQGVRSAGLIPCYPSKTFPNHYSIATGMFPDHHQLVDNSFYDRKKDATYKIGNRELVEDGTWYAGAPLWVQAARAGMVSASYFFVGSEAAIQGIRPSYFHRYDASVSKEKRVRQALDWLALPAAHRPHLITLYFSDMDDAGHRYGPNLDEKLSAALEELDAHLGTLFAGVKETNLPVNIIIVSDHGMAEITADHLMPGEEIEDDDRYRTVHNGALSHIYLREPDSLESVFHALREKKGRFSVFKTSELPYLDTSPSSHRWGDIIVVPDAGYYFSSARAIALKKTLGAVVMGEHGFDPDVRDMHGIFYASGPAFRQGMAIPAFRNVHVFPLVCHLLGLEVPAGVDGRLEVLSGILRK
jgi:predicted AlkP superfamily pyrophosphatase or phosphodiesterase